MSAAAMTSISVVGSGMVTAVGFNASATCAAIRAHIRNVQPTNLWDAESGELLAAGRVKLPHWSVGTDKLADLAVAPILECFEAAEPIAPRQQIPVLIGIPSADQPCRVHDLDRALFPEIEARLGFTLNLESRLVARGHVSVVVALQRARALIMDLGAPCVIVAGVDSLLTQELSDHYLSMRRLLTPKNSNGFSPGEAGSAVLVAPSGRGPELQILGMGLAHERATIESDQPLLGDGLTDAIRTALRDASLTSHDLEFRITDLNGEHYKFKEMVLSMMRFDRKPRPKLFDLWHPIEYVGDVGAAIGSLVLGVALDAGAKGYGIGPTALCTFGDDNGERAAIVVGYRQGRS